jgi:hypothetical protein
MSNTNASQGNVESPPTCGNKQYRKKQKPKHDSTTS